MESAYVLMSATFGSAVVTGAVTRNNWAAVGLPMLIPILFTASKIKGPGLGETLLFVSPFLVAGAIVYAGIAYAGVRLGRVFRRPKQNPESNHRGRAAARGAEGARGVQGD